MIRRHRISEVPAASSVAAAVSYVQEPVDLFDDDVPTVETNAPASLPTPLNGGLRMARLGVPIAPIKAGEKFPPISGFQILATTDETQIMAWANEQRWLNCNWLALARPEGFCFIDEDQSARFRKMYEEKYGESFPQTRATQSQTDHKQSVWKQTDRTRALGNRVQGDFLDRMLSFRQDRHYCVCEGSHLNPSELNGPNHRDYLLVDDFPILEMPDKLVDFIESLIVADEKQNRKRRGDEPEMFIDGRPVPKEPPVPGFKALFEAVGWEPLIRRMNKDEDPRFHDQVLGVGASNAYCPIPSHGDRDLNVVYSPCFGVVPGEESLLHCLLCGWSGDLVKACHAVDGDEKKTMYDIARAICIEENLNFEDYFPPCVPAEPTLKPKQGNEADKSTVAENFRETSLFVFKNQENAKAAIDWGFKSVAAEAFKMPVDFAFRRVIYVGDDRGPLYRKIYSAMNGKGVVSVKAPKEFSAENLEKVLSWDAIKTLNLTNPKMMWVREDILQQTEGYALEFKYPSVEGSDFDFILGPMMGAGEGWCPRGDPHIIAGPSGGSKTTLIMDLLQAQFKKERFLGHETFGLPYLVVMADRGIRAFRRTMKRMGIDYTQIPVERLRMVRDAGAIWAILRKIEECNPRPAIVFVEGADMLVKDASKMEIVTAFMDGLQRIASHYHISIILSVGSPKQKVGENYVAKRDQVIGTIAWGRTAETIIVMQYLEGDDTDRRRSVSVLLRNSMAEKYKMAFENGRLIPDNHVPDSQPKTPSEIVWFKAQPGWFTAMDLKESLGKGKSWAYLCCAENLTKRVLRTKKTPSGEARQYHWNEENNNPFLGVDATLDEPEKRSIAV